MNQNQAGQVINAQMISAATGAPFAGSVTVNVTIDTGAQTAGSGTVTAKGTGQYQYLATQAETNGSLIAFQFVGSGAVDVVVNVATITAAQAASLRTSTSTTQTLVSDLFTLCLKRINVLQAGESLSAADGQDCLLYANIWLDSLAIERLMIPFILRTTFPMTSGQASYTVGMSGDINIPVPAYIEHMNYIDGSLTPAIERELPYLTDDAYAAIPIKTLTNPLPSFYYWNPTYANNQATLSFWLVPTSSVLTGVLYAKSPVAQFGALTDTIVVPPGWLFFLQENLSVMFAATFRENVPIDSNLLESARTSKAAIKRVNTRLEEMSVDPALTWRTSRSNIYTGN